jgi:DMSO/TMAO reductase YedYZ molybdopterin-dependent catalytic subunit
MTISRRKLIVSGVATAAGFAGLNVAARLAQSYGLVPPDCGGIYGAGTSLTYASLRMLAGDSPAREFSRDQISPRPLQNEVAPLGKEFERLQAGKFQEWRVAVDGMVARPAAYSIDELKSYPSHQQITELACEEGWSYIAEWNGVPLSHILSLVGTHPEARYVVYQSIQDNWWDSIDMADALHPQTLVTYGMNSDDLPVASGGPVRLRVPRQLGYKSVKFLNRITVVDDIRKFRNGLGAPNSGYSWFAGI